MRVLATHSIRQFPLHFPSRASLCATRFRTSSTGSFPGVRRPWRGVDHPHNLAPRLQRRAISPLPLWAFLACSGGTVPLPLLLVPTNVCKTSVLPMATLLRHFCLASTPALQLRATTSIRGFPLLLSPIRCRKPHPD